MPVNATFTATDRWIREQLRVDLPTARGIRLAIERAGIDAWQIQALPWDEARDLVQDVSRDLRLATALKRLHVEEDRDYNEADLALLQEQQEDVTRYLVRAHLAKQQLFWHGLAVVLRVHSTHPSWTPEQALAYARQLEPALRNRERYRLVRGAVRNGWLKAQDILTRDNRPTPFRVTGKATESYRRRERVEVKNGAYVGAPHGRGFMPRRVRAPKTAGYVALKAPDGSTSHVAAIIVVPRRGNPRNTVRGPSPR